MAKKFTGLSMKRLNKVVQLPSVVAALDNRAAATLHRTRAIALRAGAPGFARALRVTTGTRPGTRAKRGLKRTYARVGAPVDRKIHLSDSRSSLSRRQILRRGARG